MFLLGKLSKIDSRPDRRGMNLKRAIVRDIRVGNVNNDTIVGALRWQAVERDCVHVQPGSNGFSTLFAKRTERQRLLFCTYAARPYAAGTISNVTRCNSMERTKNRTLGGNFVPSS